MHRTEAVGRQVQQGDCKWQAAKTAHFICHPLTAQATGIIGKGTAERDFHTESLIVLMVQMYTLQTRLPLLHSLPHTYRPLGNALCPHVFCREGIRRVQPRITVNPRLDFWFCCPTLLTFGYLTVFLIYPWIVFALFSPSLPTMLWT